MKFIKVYQQDERFFNLINLANVTHITSDKVRGTCQVFLTTGDCLSFEQPSSDTVLKQISEYNRQVIEHLTADTITEDDF